MDLYTSKAANALKYAGKVAKKLHHSYRGLGAYPVGTAAGDRQHGGVADPATGYGVYEEEDPGADQRSSIAPETTQAVMDSGWIYAPGTSGAGTGGAGSTGAVFCPDWHGASAAGHAWKEQDSVAARLLNTAGIDAQKMYIDLLTAMGQEVRVTREDLRGGKFLRGCRCRRCHCHTHLGCLQQGYHGTGPGREA